MKNGFALCLLLILSACTAVDDPFLNATSATPDGPALARSVPPGRALATLPGLVATDIRQTTRGEAAEQVMLYPNRTDGAGENTLSVTLGTHSAMATDVRAPARAMIETEMRDAVPGVAMHIDDAIGDNAYGAYGTATGSLKGGGGCVYAWQVVRRLPSSRLSASVRLRYCDPSTRPESLAAMMNGLRIQSIDGRTPDRLASAGGPGAPALSPTVPVQAPVIAPVVVNDTVASRRPLRVRPQIEARTDTSASDEEAMAPPPGLAHAAKVPLPGGAAAAKPVGKVVQPAAASPPSPAPPSAAVSAKIPLPGA